MQSGFRWMFLKKCLCSCITSSITCTYCDVRPQHFTCQNLCNVSTFLLDIGETQLLHWCCLCNNLMGAFIYQRTSLYKLILQQSLNSNLVCLWNTFCTGAHHYLGQGFRTVSASLLFFSSAIPAYSNTHSRCRSSLFPVSSFTQYQGQIGLIHPFGIATVPMYCSDSTPLPL